MYLATNTHSSNHYYYRTINLFSLTHLYDSSKHLISADYVTFIGRPKPPSTKSSAINIEQVKRMQTILV